MPFQIAAPEARRDRSGPFAVAEMIEAMPAPAGMKIPIATNRWRAEVE
jgi:hypothetical protein